MYFVLLEDYIAEEVVTTSETNPVRDVEMSADTISNEISATVTASKTDEPDQQSYDIYSQFLSFIKL